MNENTGRRMLSLLLAFLMVFGGIGPFEFKSQAAGRTVVLPNDNNVELKQIFDFYQREGLKFKTTPIKRASDGADSVMLVYKENIIGGLVSKEKYDMLNDNFSFTANITSTYGNIPGDRGMALAFHNDPRGRTAMGGEWAALGIHGNFFSGSEKGRNLNEPLQNAIAVELDPQNNYYAPNMQEGKYYDHGMDKYHFADDLNHEIQAPDGTPYYVNYKYGYSGGHVAIVKPTKTRENVIHEAVSFVGPEMTTGISINPAPHYKIDKPPVPQTIKVDWTVNGNETYTLSYTFYLRSNEVDTQGAKKVFTGSKTMTKNEVIDLFSGGEPNWDGKAWFGIYAGAEPNKWEFIRVGFEMIRPIQIKFQYPRYVYDDEGNETLEYAEVPSDMMSYPEKKRFNGRRRISDLPPLPNAMKGWITPDEKTGEPLTPIAVPDNMGSKNHENKATFFSTNFDERTIDIYVPPLKAGSQTEARNTPAVYNIGVSPKLVNVTVEHVLNGEVEDTELLANVPLGSEAAVLKTKNYAGYKPKSASNGATFIGKQNIIAKKVVPFDTVENEFASYTAQPKKALFQIIYEVDEQAITALVNKFRKDHSEILNKTTADQNDLDKVLKALAEYDNLPQQAKEKLTNEKNHLDILNASIQASSRISEAEMAVRKASINATEDTVNTAKEALSTLITDPTYSTLTPDQQAKVTELNKTINVAEKISKIDTSNPASVVLPITEVDNEIKKLANGENKNLLLKQLNEKRVSVWKKQNEAIFKITPAEVQEGNRAAIDSALNSFNLLPMEAQSELTQQKNVLDELLKALNLEKARQAVLEASKDSSDTNIQNAKRALEVVNESADILTDLEKKRS